MLNINVIELQEKLKSNSDFLEAILNKLEYKNIKDRGKYFSCANKDGDNSGAVVLWKDSLRYSNYTRNHEGNIITLVMNDKNCSFPKALEYIADWIGFKSIGFQIIRPFHGFYKEIAAEQRGEIPVLNEYSWDMLPDPNCFSKKFIDDHIDAITQKDWRVRYSIDDDAILIPVLDLNGRLIGTKARNNTETDMAHRYYAYLPYQKNAVVYGAYQNYYKLIAKNTVIITEAEKSVLQGNSFGCNNIVAIAGHSISNVQANIIKSLMCKNIIVAFDQGVCEEEVRYEAEKLKSNNALIKNNIYYLYDKKGIYLNNKESPTDNGKKLFQLMLKECRYSI